MGVEDKQGKLEIPKDIQQLIVLKMHIDRYFERISKAEENKHRVAPRIFEKVKAEYEAKATKLAAELDRKLTEFRDRIHEIENIKNSLENWLHNFDERFDEIQLRYWTGELEEAKFHELSKRYKQISDTRQNQVDKLNGILQAMQKSTEPKADETVFSLFAGASKVPFGGKCTGSPSTEGPNSRLIKLKDIFGSDFDGQIMPKLEKDLTFPALYIFEGPFQGHYHPLEGKKVTIGRVHDNDIQIEHDVSVSRHHAEFRYEDGIYEIVDLNSSNGTLVNGRLVITHELKGGDEIVIGETKLLYIESPKDEKFKKLLSVK